MDVCSISILLVIATFVTGQLVALSKGAGTIEESGQTRVWMSRDRELACQVGRAERQSKAVRGNELNDGEQSRAATLGIRTVNHTGAG